MQICIFCSVIKTPFLWTYQRFSRAQTHRNHPTMVPPKVYPEPLWAHQKLKYQSHGTHVKATVARKWMNGCYSLGYHFSLQVPFGTAVPNNEPTNIEICYVLTGPNWWYHICLTGPTRWLQNFENSNLHQGFSNMHPARRTKAKTIT